jgi:hypothetical protein
MALKFHGRFGTTVSILQALKGGFASHQPVSRPVGAPVACQPKFSQGQVCDAFSETTHDMSGSTSQAMNRTSGDIYREIWVEGGANELGTDNWRHQNALNPIGGPSSSA